MAKFAREFSGHIRICKSPRFSVANVPVAGQTAVGTLFSSKNRKENRNRLRLRVARKIARLSGVEKKLSSFGAQKSMRFFTCVRKSQSQSQTNRDAWCTQVRIRIRIRSHIAATTVHPDGPGLSAPELHIATC